MPQHAKQAEMLLAWPQQSCPSSLRCPHCSPPCSGLSGPTLYTNINVGRGTNALYSGGPSRSGANAAAGTTWWFIQRQGGGLSAACAALPALPAGMQCRCSAV